MKAKIFLLLLLSFNTIAQCVFTINGSLDVNNPAQWTTSSNWSLTNCATYTCSSCGVCNPSCDNFRATSMVNIIVNNYVIITDNLFNSSKPNVNITVNGTLFFDKTGNGQLNLGASSTVTINNGARLVSTDVCSCNSITIGNGQSEWKGNCGSVYGLYSFDNEDDVCSVLSLNDLKITNKNDTLFFDKNEYHVYRLLFNSWQLYDKVDSSSFYVVKDFNTYYKLFSTKHNTYSNIVYVEKKYIISSDIIYYDIFFNVINDIFNHNGFFIEYKNNTFSKKYK